jgi:hypothetical protein
MNPTMEEKRKAAIEYLRSRGIYILDNKFKPTSATATDVQQTITRYLKATNQQKLTVVEKKK